MNISTTEEEKLASMKEMMDNIAHQWRQPLSQINSIVSVLDNRLYELNIDDEIINEKLLEIEKLTKYMSDTIDDFKGYFDEDDTKKEFVINDVIEDVVSVIGSSLKKDAIELRVSTDGCYTLYGYPNELKQIIIVLINNAKDVLLKRNVHQAKIEISLKEDPQAYVIEVCDNGGGMTRTVMQKIFEPYFTTKHKSQGTGLGLYMSRKIIQERFCGSLSVRNIHNGVLFSITLPKGGING